SKNVILSRRRRTSDGDCVTRGVNRTVQDFCSETKWDLPAMTRTMLVRLVFFFRLQNALVNRLAAAETFRKSVPVGDLVLPQLPAKKNSLVFDQAGKIEQADIQVFHLHTGGINFGEGIFYRLHGLVTRSLAAGDFDDIHVAAAAQENAAVGFLQLRFNLLDELLALHGRAQQR